MIERDQPKRVDRLETALQEIKAAQQTGICHAERGKGGVRETGIIVFLFGQIVEATSEGRSGIEALSRLQTWGNCSYTFEARTPAEIEVTPPPELPPANASATTTPLGFISQIIPNISPTPQKTPTLAEEAGIPEQGAYLEDPSRASETAQVPTPPFSLSTFPPATPNGYTPTTPNRYVPNGRAASPPAAPNGYAPNGRIPFPSTSPYTSGPLTPDPRFQNRPQPVARAPYRLMDGPEALAFIDRVGLTRLHRHIFLLLDGKRDANDLARITRHPLRDIQHLLTDLERYGLIKQETMPETFY